jgi:hypothetical protein
MTEPNNAARATLREASGERPLPGDGHRGPDSVVFTPIRGRRRHAPPIVGLGRGHARNLRNSCKCKKQETNRSHWITRFFNDDYGQRPKAKDEQDYPETKYSTREWRMERQS